MLAAAFAWSAAQATPYSIIDLGTFGGPSSRATSINDARQVTGSADDSSSFLAFRYAGTLEPLGAGAESQGHAIDSAGRDERRSRGGRIDAGTEAVVTAPASRRSTG